MAAEHDKYIIFDAASSSPLGQVKLAGILKQSRGVVTPRVFGFYALVYVTGGRGYFRDEMGYTRSVSPGDLLFIFPEISHIYGPTGDEPWSETFIVFEGSVFDMWRQQGLLEPKTPFCHLEPVEHWHQRIIAAVWADPQPGTGFALARLCRVQQLLADVTAYQQRISSIKTSWLAEATELLQEYIDAPPNYAELAKTSGMTYEGFRKRFAREAGIAPGKYVTQMRMEQACERLVGSQATIKDVARDLGFFDEFHFSKQFKKTIGMTPKEFRRFFE